MDKIYSRVHHFSRQYTFWAGRVARICA